MAASRLYSSCVCATGGLGRSLRLQHWSASFNCTTGDQIIAVKWIVALSLVCSRGGHHGVAHGAQVAAAFGACAQLYCAQPRGQACDAVAAAGPF